MADTSEIGVALNFVEQVLEVAVGVGIAISEIDFVVAVLKSVIPWQSKIGFIFGAAFAVTVLIVLDVVSSSVPA